jgi:hypothetical protein
MALMNRPAIIHNTLKNIFFILLATKPVIAPIRNCIANSMHPITIFSPVVIDRLHSRQARGTNRTIGEIHQRFFLILFFIATT